MGLNRSIIDKINLTLLKKIKPHIVFLNIIKMKTMKKRLNLRKNKNRYDIFETKFYQKVQNGFLKISKKKSNYVIIDSNSNLAENKKKVINNIIKFIK